MRHKCFRVSLSGHLGKKKMRKSWREGFVAESPGGLGHSATTTKKERQWDLNTKNKTSKKGTGGNQGDNKKVWGVEKKRRRSTG